MKKIIKSNALLFFFICSLVLMGCQNNNQEQMRHIVIFKYKPTASEAQIEKVTTALRDLKDKIPGIVSFEHGINNSPENKNMGFSHVYLFTFKDAAARDTYLPHPEHKKFGAMLGELNILEDAFVVDYAPNTK